jgi:hypothetical protein
MSLATFICNKGYGPLEYHMTNNQLVEIHLNNSDLSLSNLAAISNRTEAEVLVVLKDSNYINILKGQ